MTEGHIKSIKRSAAHESNDRSGFFAGNGYQPVYIAVHDDCMNDRFLLIPWYFVRLIADFLKMDMKASSVNASQSAVEKLSISGKGVN